MMRRIPPLIVFLALLATPALVMGQYQLTSYVIGSGAMNGSSDNFQARGTVGQPAIGYGTSDSFEGSWGFWHTLSGVGGIAVLADLKVFLEGPYAGSDVMNSSVEPDSMPLSQPFNQSPWDYAGSESVASGFFAANPSVIDWVYVQVRDNTDPTSPPMTVLAERAGFVLQDGSIVDTDGSSPLSIDGLADGTYYIVVDHRNHVEAMSASGIASASSTLTYDFTDALNKAYTEGPDPMADLGDGNFGLFTGDADANGQITANDFNLWLNQTKSIAVGYNSGDFDLNNQVLASDFNAWLANTKAAAASQVPNP
jgi:hypothetical protein